MSLIQEALKRQREESGEAEPETAPPPIQMPGKKLSSLSPTGSAPQAPAAPEKDTTEPSSPTLPEQVLEPTETKPRAWPVVLGVGMLLVLLVGGIVWGTMLILKKDKPADSQPVIGKPTSKPAPAESKPETPQVKPAPAEVKPAAKPAVKPTAKPVPAVVKPGSPSSKPSATVAAKPQGDEWPLLMLGGFVGKGASGSAIINNEIVGINEMIDGVRVVEIANQGVTLEYNGKTMFIRVGASTR